MVIIAIMESTDMFALVRGRCRLIKNDKACDHLKHFFRPATTFLTGPSNCFRTAVAGVLVDLTQISLRLRPVTARSYIADAGGGTGSDIEPRLDQAANAAGGTAGAFETNERNQQKWNCETY